ncbi:uncharacterized [Tachysurus ichikawai]
MQSSCEKQEHFPAHAVEISSGLSQDAKTHSFKSPQHRGQCERAGAQQNCAELRYQTEDLYWSQKLKWQNHRSVSVQMRRERNVSRMWTVEMH